MAQYPQNAISVCWVSSKVRRFSKLQTEQYFLHIKWEYFSWTFWFYLWRNDMRSLKIQPEVKTLRHLQACSVKQKTMCTLITFFFFSLFAELLVLWATLKSSVKLSIAQQIPRWTEGQNPAGCGRCAFQVFCQEGSTMRTAAPEHKPTAGVSELQSGEVLLQMCLPYPCW